MQVSRSAGVQQSTRERATPFHSHCTLLSVCPLTFVQHCISHNVIPACKSTVDLFAGKQGSKGLLSLSPLQPTPTAPAVSMDASDVRSLAAHELLDQQGSTFVVFHPGEHPSPLPGLPLARPCNACHPPTPRWEARAFSPMAVWARHAV